MGILIDEIQTLLREHLRQHGVVVWFDPERAYTAILPALDLPETHLHAYDPFRGFLSLRRELELLWSAPQKPHLLLYVPLASSQTANALVEYLASGARLEPGAHPPECNTRLAVVARRALEKAVPAAAAETIVRDIEAGRLALSDAEAIAGRMIEVQTGALALVFGTGNPDEIALRFLTEPGLDADLQTRAALPPLAELLRDVLGVALPADQPAALRQALGRQVLLVDFLTSLRPPMPERYRAIPLPENQAARETSARLAAAWRRRRDLSESYIQHTRALEAELGLGAVTWSLEHLQDCETFALLENRLQEQVELALTAKATPILLELARRRLAGFWPGQEAGLRLRWQIIQSCAGLLLLSERIQTALRSSPSAAQILARYTAAEDPWCELDNLNRKLERDNAWHDLDIDQEDSLVRLVAAAQMRYAEVANSLATQFVHSFEQAGLDLPGVPQQVRIFVDEVAPAAEQGKTAYLMVDAFRYEMARELCGQMPEDWQVQLKAALAEPPTITEVGMAALLPGAQRGLTIVPAGAGKLGVLLEANPLRSRAERLAHAEARAGVASASCTLNDLTPLKDRGLRTRLSAARLIFVTASDEIDGLWESHPNLARQLQDHAFEQLRRGVRSLFNLGVQQVILSADHGFLTGGRSIPGEPVDPPHGKMADLHRRVWVGRGGTAMPGFLRKPLSAFGSGGDLELVTPYNLAIFRSPGGSLDYFHGGLSPQELIIPVMTIRNPQAGAAEGLPAFLWELTLGSPRISTRLYTVTIRGQAKDLLAVPPHVRMELRAGDQILSQPVGATYGYQEATGDVALKFASQPGGELEPNTVFLQIAVIPEAKTVSLVLLDEIGAVLSEVKSIPIDVAL